MANKTNKPAVKSQVNANADDAIFGGVASAVDPNTVQAPIVSDGANDLSDATPELAPEVSQQVADTKVFKGQADTFYEKEEKQSITLEKTVFDNILNRLNQLESKASGDEEAISLLNNTKKDKQVRVSFFIDPIDAQAYLLAGLEPVKLPTGAIVTSYKKPAKDPIDGALRLKDHMRVKLYDFNTNQYTIKEVVQEEFLQNTTSKYHLVKSESKEAIDLTPSDEQVVMTSYVESGQYIRRETSGTPVKIEVSGASSTYVVEIDGKDYNLPENVVNFR